MHGRVYMLIRSNGHKQGKHRNHDNNNDNSNVDNQPHTRNHNDSISNMFIHIIYIHNCVFMYARVTYVCTYSSYISLDSSSSLTLSGHTSIRPKNIEPCNLLSS